MQTALGRGAVEGTCQLDLESAAAVNRTGTLYQELLLDLDQLLATDGAFLLGPWLDRARRLGGEGSDRAGGNETTRPIVCGNEAMKVFLLIHVG